MNTSISVSLSDYGGKTWSFEGINELHSFLNQELIFWNDKAEKLPQELASKNQYIQVNSRLNTALQIVSEIKDNAQTLSDADVNARIQRLQRDVLRHLPGQWIWSGRPYIESYFDCLQIYGNASATAFLEYVEKGSVANIQSSDHFKGILSGYEFQHPGSKLALRSKGENLALDHLKDEFATKKVEAEQKLHNFDVKTTEWMNSRRNDWNDWIVTTINEHGFYPGFTDNSEKVHNEPGGIQWEHEESTRKSLNEKRYPLPISPV